MVMVITKETIDDLFDFLEGRKESRLTVVRGVRGANFPKNLLLTKNEKSPLADYIRGESQANISARFGVPNGRSTFQAVKNKYASQLEIYWTYTLVMEKIKPVLSIKLSDVLLTSDVPFVDTTLCECYKNEIYTIGDLINSLTTYEVITNMNRLKLRGNKNTVFKKIREACYMALK